MKDFKISLKYRIIFDLILNYFHTMYMIEILTIAFQKAI